MSGKSKRLEKGCLTGGASSICKGGMLARGGSYGIELFEPIVSEV